MVKTLGQRNIKVNDTVSTLFVDYPCPVRHGHLGRTKQEDKAIIDYFKKYKADNPDYEPSNLSGWRTTWNAHIDHEQILSGLMMDILQWHNANVSHPRNDYVPDFIKQQQDFDFVAKNYKSGALKNINQFKLNPSVFKDFQAFCLTKDFELNTKTELFLNKSLAAAKDENLMSLKTVATEVRKILRDQKKQAINGVKDRILWGISEEIIQREFYREGVYQYALTKHPTIQKGKSILTNLSDYYKVLK